LPTDYINPIQSGAVVYISLLHFSVKEKINTKATKTSQTKLTFLIVKLGKKPLTTTCGTSESFEAMKLLMRHCFEPTPYSSKLKL